MAKFGFAGRLGAREQGIAAPIEVAVRPERVGLAYGGLREASRLPANRGLAGDLFGTDHPEARRMGAGGRGDDSGEESGGGVRRREGAPPRRPPAAAAPRRERKVYKTAAQVLADADTQVSGAAAAPAIIDMRGATARVVAPDELGGGRAGGGQPSGPAAEHGALGRELAHNVDLLRGLAEVSLRTAHRKLKAGEVAAQRAADAAAAATDAAAVAAAWSERIAWVVGAVQAAAGALTSGIAALRSRVLAGDSGGSGAGDESDEPPLAVLAGLLEDAADAMVEVVSAAPYAAGALGVMAAAPALLAAALQGPLTWAWSLPPAPLAPSDAAAMRSLEPLAQHDRLTRLEGVAGGAGAPVVALVLALQRWRRLVSRSHRPLGAAAAAVAAGAVADGASATAAATVALLSRPPSRTLLPDIAARPGVHAALGLLLAARVSPAWADDRTSAFDTPPAAAEEGDSSEVPPAVAPAMAAAITTGVVASRAAAGALLDVCDSALGARLTAAIAAEWDAHQPALLRAVLASVAPVGAYRHRGGHSHGGHSDGDVMHEGTWVALLEHGVVPRLAAAVEAWHPGADGVPVTDWLLPWAVAPLCGHLAVDRPAATGAGTTGTHVAGAIATLFPALRTKIGAGLREWEVGDPSAAAMLAAWRGVWDAASWGSLVERAVVPRLAATLRQVEVNPAGQDITGVNGVLAWAPLLPPTTLAALLAGELLPRWLATLAHWLASGEAVGDEVIAWYRGWVSLLPPSLVASPRLVACLSTALDLMAAAAANATTHDELAAAVAAVPLPNPATTSYASLLAQAAGSGAAPAVSAAGVTNGVMPPRHAGVPPPRRPATAATAAGLPPTVSFKEVVSQAADDAGLSLLPAPRRAPVDGNAVLLLGDLPVYLAGGVLFMEARVDGRPVWQPTSLRGAIRAAAGVTRRDVGDDVGGSGDDGAAAAAPSVFIPPPPPVAPVQPVQPAAAVAPAPAVRRVVGPVVPHNSAAGRAAPASGPRSRWDDDD